MIKQWRLLLDLTLSYGVYFHGVYVRDKETDRLMTCVKVGLGRLLYRPNEIQREAARLNFAAVDNLPRYVILLNRASAKTLEENIISLFTRYTYPLVGKHRNVLLREWFSCGWDIFSPLVYTLDKQGYATFRYTTNLIMLDGGNNLLWDDYPMSVQHTLLECIE